MSQGWESSDASDKLERSLMDFNIVVLYTTNCEGGKHTQLFSIMN